MILFTDGSVEPKSGVGFGGYLCIDRLDAVGSNALKDRIVLKRFENTSSTKLELETLLWALESIDSSHDEWVVYTDSQNLLSLLDRRARLETNGFRNKSGKPLEHHLLYQQFFTALDARNPGIELRKIRGHSRKRTHTPVERVFALVDRATRKALRREHSLKGC